MKCIADSWENSYLDLGSKRFTTSKLKGGLSLFLLTEVFINSWKKTFFVYFSQL